MKTLISLQSDTIYFIEKNIKFHIFLLEWCLHLEISIKNTLIALFEGK